MSTSILPIESWLLELRDSDDTMVLLKSVPSLVLSQFWPEKEAPSATALSWAWIEVDRLLDLGLVDVFAGGRGQLVLEIVERGDGGIQAGIGGRQRRRAEAERVGDRAEGAVVRLDGGGDRPVGGVVGGGIDAQAGGNAVVGLFEV